MGGETFARGRRRVLARNPKKKFPEPDISTDTESLKEETSSQDEESEPKDTAIDDTQEPAIELIEEPPAKRVSVDIEEPAIPRVAETLEQQGRKEEQKIEKPEVTGLMPQNESEAPTAPPTGERADVQVITVPDIATEIYIREEGVPREVSGAVFETLAETSVVDAVMVSEPDIVQKKDMARPTPVVVEPLPSADPITSAVSQDVFFHPELEDQDIILGVGGEAVSVLVQDAPSSHSKSAGNKEELGEPPTVEYNYPVGDSALEDRLLESKKFSHRDSEADGVVASTLRESKEDGSDQATVIDLEQAVSMVSDIEEPAVELIKEPIAEGIVTNIEEPAVGSVSVDVEEFAIELVEDPLIARITEMFEQPARQKYQEEIEVPDVQIDQSTRLLEVSSLEITPSPIQASAKEVEASVIDLEDIVDEGAPQFVLRETLHLDDKPIQVEQEHDQESEGTSRQDSIGDQADGVEDIFLQSTVEVFMKPQERGDEDSIQVIQQGDRIILSVQRATSEDEDDVDSDEPIPVATASGLLQALELIDRLPLRIRSAEGMGREDIEDDSEDEEEVGSQITIVVSEEMLDIIEGLMRESDSSLGQEVPSEKVDFEDSSVILVTKDNDKIIFSSQRISIEDGGEKAEESELIPVTTVTELTEVFNHISKLVVDASLDNEFSKDDAVEDEQVSEVRVIVSEDMLKLIEDIREKTSLSSVQPEEDEGVMGSRVITFSTNGEDKKQLTIDSEQLLEIHKFFLESRLDDKEDSQYEESSMWIDDDGRSGDGESLMVRPEVSIVGNTSEFVAGIQEGSTIIYKSKKRVIQEQEVIEDDIVAEDQYVLLSSGGREIKIERTKLEKLMKSYAKRKQLNTDVIVNKNEYALEELVQEDGQTQDMSGTPTWVSYQLLLLLSLPDEEPSYYDVNYYNFSNNFLWQVA